MKASFCVLAAQLLGVTFLAPQAAEARLSFDDDAAKNRPVSKVITLLKDMLKQLEVEAEEDEEIYDQMACFEYALGSEEGCFWRAGQLGACTWGPHSGHALQAAWAHPIGRLHIVLDPL